MENDKKSIGCGTTLFVLVFLIFLVLKLAEIGVVANWSWWWVSAPLWIPAGIVIGILLIAGLVMLLMGIFRK